MDRLVDAPPAFRNGLAPAAIEERVEPRALRAEQEIRGLVLRQRKHRVGAQRAKTVAQRRTHVHGGRREEERCVEPGARLLGAQRVETISLTNGMV